MIMEEQKRGEYGEEEGWKVFIDIQPHGHYPTHGIDRMLHVGPRRSKIEGSFLVHDGTHSRAPISAFNEDGGVERPRLQSGESAVKSRLHTGPSDHRLVEYVREFCPSQGVFSGAKCCLLHIDDLDGG